MLTDLKCRHTMGNSGCAKVRQLCETTCKRKMYGYTFSPMTPGLDEPLGGLSHGQGHH